MYPAAASGRRTGAARHPADRVLRLADVARPGAVYTVGMRIFPERGLRRMARLLRRWRRGLRRWAGPRLARPLAALVPRWVFLEPASFAVFEARGIHVLRKHYYSPVPDVAALPGGLWNRCAEPVGIELREARQRELWTRLREAWGKEWDALPLERTPQRTRFCFENSSFRAIDAEVSYGLIRELRPRRMIEIGSGWSTLLAAQALRRNAAEGDAGELVAIDPHPHPVLSEGVPGLQRLLAVPVQEVGLHWFEALESGDILFIDSSHALRVGGDVAFEFLEILPRLQPGVRVHVHDVFLPWEYPRAWIVDEHRFFNEQYLLQALLTHNPTFEVLWASHLMERRHGELLAAGSRAYADGRFTGGCSFWMRRSPTPGTGQPCPSGPAAETASGAGEAGPGPGG